MQQLSAKHAKYVFALSLVGATLFAQEQAPTADYKSLGRRFVMAKLDADRESLDNALAPEVLLLPGHEYLKAEYGLRPDGNRRTAISVKRDKLIDLDMKVYTTFPADKKAKARELLAKSEYKFVIAERDGMTLNPHNPDDQENASLSLPTKKGDVVMIVLPKPKGDYLLYVLRRIDGVWKIVMDYTD
jgi:hypothetical protein